MAVYEAMRLRIPNLGDTIPLLASFLDSRVINQQVQRLTLLRFHLTNDPNGLGYQDSGRVPIRHQESGMRRAMTMCRDR